MNEAEFGNSFEIYIKSNPSYFFTYDMIYKEVESFQGIPDYLGIIMSHLYHGSEKTMQIPINRWHTISIILAFMKKKQFRTPNYIIQNTGLSQNIIIRDLNFLCRLGICEKNNVGNYRFVEDFEMPIAHIHSFELKMSNWKRALFQAIRYKTFSEYTSIVMPFEKEQILLQNIDSFKERNIGVLLFDAYSCETKMLYRAKKNSTISLQHLYYMSGKILLKYHSDLQVSSNIRIEN